MKFFCYIDRITLLNKIVTQGKTGNPETFAARLGISRTRLYEILDALKSHGAPIVYDKSRHTFYYEYPFEISIHVNFRPLDPTEKRNSNGGYFLSQRTCFPDATKTPLLRNVTNTHHILV